MPRRQENVVEPRQEVSGEGRRFVAIVGQGGCRNGRRGIAERIVNFAARGTYLIYSYVMEMTEMVGDTYTSTYDVAYSTYAHDPLTLLTLGSHTTVGIVLIPFQILYQYS